MSNELITGNDLKAILNEVIRAPRQGAIYSASWKATSSSANNTQLTNDITIPAGTYILILLGPIGSVDYSVGLAGKYKQMIKSGDAFVIPYTCNQTVSFHASSAQSAAVTFSYTERGSLTAVQISDQTIGTNVADYIVEQGTDGIWTYRKWNSGIAECWGYKLTSGTFSAWGSGYSHDVPPQDFPTGLFAATPCCFVTCCCTDANSVSSANAEYTTKDHAPGITVWRGTSVSGSHNFASWYYAKGTWK